MPCKRSKSRKSTNKNSTDTSTPAPRPRTQAVVAVFDKSLRKWVFDDSSVVVVDGVRYNKSNSENIYYCCMGDGRRCPNNMHTTLRSDGKRQVEEFPKKHQYHIEITKSTNKKKSPRRRTPSPPKRKSKKETVIKEKFRRDGTLKSKTTAAEEY